MRSPQETGELLKERCREDSAPFFVNRFGVCSISIFTLFVGEVSDELQCPAATDIM